jgi:hypothetical protein
LGNVSDTHPTHTGEIEHVGQVDMGVDFAEPEPVVLDLGAGAGPTVFHYVLCSSYHHAYNRCDAAGADLKKLWQRRSQEGQRLRTADDVTVWLRKVLSV